MLTTCFSTLKSNLQEGSHELKKANNRWFVIISGTGTQICFSWYFKSSTVSFYSRSNILSRTSHFMDAKPRMQGKFTFSFSQSLLFISFLMNITMCVLKSRIIIALTIIIHFPAQQKFSWRVHTHWVLPSVMSHVHFLSLLSNKWVVFFFVCLFVCFQETCILGWNSSRDEFSHVNSA